MAEFVEVMRQARRMCKSYGDECGPCVLHEKYGLCPLCAQTDDHIPADWKLDNMADVERIVMDWAAAHPEPRYPTRKEWQDTNFPNNDALMRPCIFESEEYFNCKEGDGCEKCMNKPIPADIAEKLGIKPMGGGLPHDTSDM